LGRVRRDAALVEGAGDAGGAGPGQALGEDPSYVRCGGWVRVEAVQASSPAGVLRVGVCSGVDEAVAIRWAAAEVAALGAGLGAHRDAGAPAGAQDFPFGLVAQQ
jgi:hypothetical protein